MESLTLTNVTFVNFFQTLSTNSLLEAFEKGTSMNNSLLFQLYRLLMQNEGLPSTQWQMGKSKIFLRGNVHEPLEDKRIRLLNGSATKIQKTWKGQRQRRNFVEIREATKKIQQSFIAWKLRIQFLRKRRAAIVIQVNIP